MLKCAYSTIEHLVADRGAFQPEHITVDRPDHVHGFIGRVYLLQPVFLGLHFYKGKVPLRKYSI